MLQTPLLAISNKIPFCKDNSRDSEFGFPRVSRRAGSYRLQYRFTDLSRQHKVLSMVLQKLPCFPLLHMIWTAADPTASFNPDLTGPSTAQGAFLVLLPGISVGYCKCQREVTDRIPETSFLPWSLHVLSYL